MSDTVAAEAVSAAPVVTSETQITHPSEQDVAKAAADQVEIERQWNVKLYEFMARRGTPIERLPVFDRAPLNLHALYQAVTRFGGLHRVIDSKLWRRVTKELNVDPERTDAGYRLRIHYTNLLLPFETEFFTAAPEQRRALSREAVRSSDRRRKIVSLPVTIPTPIFVPHGGNRGVGAPQQTQASSEITMPTQPLRPVATLMSSAPVAAAVGATKPAAIKAQASAQNVRKRGEAGASDAKKARRVPSRDRNVYETAHPFVQQGAHPIDKDIRLLANLDSLTLRRFVVQQGNPEILKRFGYRKRQPFQANRVTLLRLARDLWEEDVDETTVIAAFVNQIRADKIEVSHM